MSNDNKNDNKNQGHKQAFFRINSKGELTQADQKTVIGEIREEAKETEQEPKLQFEDFPTEIQSNEPSAFSLEREYTQSNLQVEPKQISLSEDNNPVEPISLMETPQETEPSEPNEAAEVIQQDFQVDLKTAVDEVESHSPFEEMVPPAPAEAPIIDNDLATLRSYIAIKEKEVSDLKEQQKQYQNVLLKLKRTHGELLDSNQDLHRELAASQTNEQLIKKELSHLREKHENEIAILKNDFAQNQQQQGNYQEQIEDLNRQKNIWKEKISEDLKKIKLKEKELENRYELLKKDTETLLDSKDNQVLELKKKSDALELELESLEDRLRSEHAILNSIEGKKRRLIETLRLAISLLEEIDSNSEANQERKTG
jgi:hypothetical protein